MTIVADPRLSEELIRERQEKGLDRQDEVWEGEYIIMPDPNDEHQDLVAGLTAALYTVIQSSGLGKVRPGVNVSDRVEGWRENYRCPDVVVYLNETEAENHGTFWFGGPEFAVEIVSPGDRTRDKFEFYASVGTRELLIIDREPWRLELHRLTGGRMKLVGRSTPEKPDMLRSKVVPLSWQLVEGEGRPRIRAVHSRSAEEWTI